MKELSLNEEKLAELERAVTEALGAVDYEKKGCFGTLLSDNGDYCLGCADRIPCKAAMEANEGALIAEVNEAAVEAEVAEVDAKLAEAEELEAKAKAEAAEAELLETEKAKVHDEIMAKVNSEPVESGEYVYGGNDRMRVRGAEVNGFEFKIKSKIKVDWNAVVSEVFGKKPTSFKQMAAIVKGYVDKGYSASAYGWTNKLIQRLAAQGVIEYNADAKLIAWV